MRYIRSVLLLFGWLLYLQGAAAVAQPVQALTPEACVQLGLERNSLLQAAAAGAAEARAAYRQARSQRLPTVSSQASYTRLSSNIPAIEVEFPSLPGLDTTHFTIAPVALDRYYAQVSVEQPLFSGFRLHNSIRAAGHQAEAAALEAQEEAVNVAFEIRWAYWGLYRALALREVVDAALDQVEAYLRDVHNRREAGAATESDVLTAQTRHAEVRLDRVEAENAIRIARLQLNHLSGLPLDTPVQPVASVEVMPLPADVEALVARALQGRPGLNAQSEQIEAIEADVDATQGTWFPDVALTGRYVYARPNQYFFTEQDAFRGTWEAGVSMTWNIWDWGQRAARTNQARARLRSAEARLAYTRENVAVDVHRQYLEVQRAAEAVQATEQSVHAAEEGFRVMRQRFQEGAALSSEVLDAELAHRTARSRRAEALADYAVARAGLLYALGQVYEEE